MACLHHLPPSHFVLESSSSSWAGILPNHPPASRQPDTPPREPGLICCWMRQLVCWRTEAVSDPGDEMRRCLTLSWHFGTLVVQRHMVQEPPGHFLDLSLGWRWLPCLGELSLDSWLLGSFVWGEQGGEDWLGSQRLSRLKSCCYPRGIIDTNGGI